LETIKIASQLL